VDRISGGLVTCLVMVPPGTNEHSYEPHPAQMSLLSHAKAYFAIGLEFEGPWIPKFASMAKGIRMVHTDSLVEKIASTDADEPRSAPSSESGRPAAGLDPHIWLSPALVRQQAATIAAALEEIDTLHAAAYRANFVSFLRGIDSLDRRLRAILRCDSGEGVARRKTFLVFHPTWGYFAKDYCLRQVAIEVEGKEPSPRMMKSILDTARFYKIRTVFVQPEFSRTSAEVIAHEIGAGVLDADALAYDWKDNLLYVAQKIAEQ
jgi:zinc transport system substrate-binding protein